MKAAMLSVVPAQTTALDCQSNPVGEIGFDFRERRSYRVGERQKGSVNDIADPSRASLRSRGPGRSSGRCCDRNVRRALSAWRR